MIQITYKKYDTIVILLLAVILACQIVIHSVMHMTGFDWLSYLFWIIVAIDLGVLLVRRKVIVFNEEE